MSGSNELGIRITATSTATPTLKDLQTNIKSAEAEINRLNASGVDGTNRFVAVLRQSVDAWKQQLNAIQQSSAGVKSTTSAFRELGDAANVVHRSLQESLNIAGIGAEATRTIKSAASAAGVLQSSLSDLAYGDSLVRDSQIATRNAVKETTAAIYAQAEATKTLASIGALARAEQFGRPGVNIERMSAADLRSRIESNTGTGSTLGSGSAAASAGVFAAGGLTATETALGLSNATIIAAEAQDKLAASTTKALDALGAEAIASRKAQEALAIPTAPSGMSPNVSMPGVPTFLSRQKNAEGEAEETAGSAALSGINRSASAARSSVRGVSSELGHAVAIFDELERGNRGAIFSTLGAAARDAGLGVVGLTSSLGGLVAIIGVGAVLRGAENLGKWATQAKATASALGMTIEEFTGFQAALKSLGMKGDEADASMKRLAESLSKALANPASLAAEAFHNLGISQDMLKTNGQDVAGVMRLLADAYTRTADGANKTANMTELAGLNYRTLVPLIQNGSAAMDDMTEHQRILGNTLDEEGAAKAREMSDKVHELSDKIEGEGKQALLDWAPVIIQVTDLLMGLSHALSVVANGIGYVASHLGDAAKAAANEGSDLAAAISGDDSPLADAMRGANGQIRHKGEIYGPQPEQYGPPAPAKTEVAPLTPVEKSHEATPQQTMREQMTAAALAAANGAKTAAAARQAEAQAEISVMQKTLASAKLNAEQRAQIESELAQKQISLRNMELSAADSAAKKGASAAKAAAKQSYEDFAAGERQKIAAADGSMAKIAAIYDQWLAAASNTYKQQANVILEIERQKTQAINTERLKQIKLGMQDTQALDKAAIVLGQGAAINDNISKGTPDKNTGSSSQSVAQITAEAAAIQATSSKEIADLQQVMSTASQGSATQREAATEILSIITQSKTQEIALYNKAAAATADAAKKALEPLTKLFDEIGNQAEELSSSVLKAVIAPKKDIIKQGLTSRTINEGSTELHQAFAKFGMDIVQDATKTIEDQLSKVAAKQLGSLIGVDGSGGLGALFANGLSKLTGIGSSATKTLDTAQFGLATTQLQTAATTLQTAATTLAGTATASSSSAAASSAQSIGMTTALAPLTASVTTGNASTVAAITSSASTIVGTLTANNSLLIGAIEAQGTTQDVELAALNAKPSILGFTYSQGGIVPSAAGGMVVGGMGNGGQLSILHAREMVLPQNLSRGIQSIINSNGEVRGGNRGGNNANLNYSPTINTNTRGGRSGTGMTRSEFSQVLSSHGGQMLGEARNLMRSGMRPGI